MDAEDASPQAMAQAMGKRILSRSRKLLWQRKIGPAFWTISSLVSMTVNVILVVILVLTARQLFTAKDLINNQLIGGLYYNFVLMDRSRITTTIEVNDTIKVEDSIPVVFDLPLKQNTRVVLSEDASIQAATIYLNGVAVPLDLVLHAGTALDINLDLTVPVSQTVPVILDVPVHLTVPVDIPLNETELHQPFTGLQEVISPYYWQLAAAPGTWQETPVCASGMDWLCNWLTERR